MNGVSLSHLTQVRGDHRYAQQPTVQHLSHSRSPRNRIIDWLLDERLASVSRANGSRTYGSHRNGSCGTDLAQHYATLPDAGIQDPYRRATSAGLCLRGAAFSNCLR